MKTILSAAVAMLLAGGAISAVTAQTQTGDKTPSTVDGKMEPRPGQKMDPGSVGAMDKSATGVATSAQDVARQTEGKPTMADQAKNGKSDDSKSGMTQNSPGTVGAAPGVTPPADKK